MSYVDETIQIVIPRRSTDENTCAIVVAKRNLAIQSASDLARAIRRSVDSWIRETADGRDALELSGDDFNAGDLDQYWDTSPLKEYLAKNSVKLLSYAVFQSEATSWDYDDHLWDDSEPLPELRT